MTDKTEYPCPHEGCSKVLKSRAGIYKHSKKCSYGNDTIGSSEPESQSVSGEVNSSSSLPPTDDPDIGTIEDKGDWMDFDLGDSNETDHIPAALKMITSQPSSKKKKSVKELKAIKDTEIGLLKMGLGGIDVILTQYGKGVTLDKEFNVAHGDKTKTLVANAQHAWLDEKGITISKYASKGMIAGSLTAYYVGGPIMRIKKEAKKPMIKRIGGGFRGFLGRLPLIGRLFKKKVKEEPTVFGDLREYTGDELDESI